MARFVRFVILGFCLMFTGESSAVAAPVVSGAGPATALDREAGGLSVIDAGCQNPPAPCPAPCCPASNCCIVRPTQMSAVAQPLDACYYDLLIRSENWPFTSRATPGTNMAHSGLGWGHRCWKFRLTRPRRMLLTLRDVSSNNGNFFELWFDGKRMATTPQPATWGACSYIHCPVAPPPVWHSSGFYTLDFTPNVVHTVQVRFATFDAISDQDIADNVMQHGNAVDFAWSWVPLETAKIAVVKIEGQGHETPIEEIADPIWETAFGPAPQCELEAPSRNLPLAGGFSQVGPTLNVTLAACPQTPSYSPRVKYQWTIPTTMIPLASRADSGSFAGWTGTIPLTLPAGVGKTAIDLVFDIYDDQNNLITSQQRVHLDVVYVGYDVARGPRSEPKLLWLESATRWARGGGEPGGIASLLVGGIFGNGGWLYRDVRPGWPSLIAGVVDQANCYTMSEMWEAMTKILGLGEGTLDSTRGLGYGFVTKPDHRQSFDPGQSGNAHAHGASVDRWVFGSHQVGSMSGSYYDPTFNNTFQQRAAFILWNITGWALRDADGALYLPAELGHGVYPLSSAPPWGDCEYRPSMLPPSLLAALEAPRGDLGTEATTGESASFTVVPASGGAGIASAAGFEGPFTWTALDTDADGEAEALLLGGTIRVSSAAVGSLSWLGALNAGATPVTTRSGGFSSGFAGGRLESAAVGTHSFTIQFSGEDIRSGAHAGPYSAKLFLTDDAGLVLDTLGLASPAYLATQFGERDARVQSSTDTGVDTNGNGKFEGLGLDVLVSATRPTTVGLSALARSPADDALIDQAGTRTTIPAGTSMVHVQFDGRRFSAAGVDGPYPIDVQITDTGEATSPPTRRYSAAYLASSFEPPRMAVAGAVTDSVRDTNGDGSFEALVLNVPLNVLVAGQYQYSAVLTAGGIEVASTTGLATLPAGATRLTLLFDGSEIAASGADGPYRLHTLRISAPDGTSALSRNDLHDTPAYLAGSFAPAPPPLVALTGIDSGAGDDVDGDGRFDDLVFDVGVVASQSGDVVVRATLYAPSGKIIGWASGLASIVAGVPAGIEVRFDGGRIFSRGEDGPYQVREAIAYMTDTPERPAVDRTPHATGSYSWTQFRPVPIIGGSVRLYPSSPLEGARVTLNVQDDFDYASTTGEYPLAVASLSGPPVLLGLEPRPGYPASGWSSFINDVFSGTGLAVSVPPDTAVVRVDFVYGAPVRVDPSGRAGSSRLWLAPIPSPARVGGVVRFQYAVPAGSLASVNVYDVGGRLVRRLDVRTALAPSGVITWDTRDATGAAVVPGIYLVRLEVERSSGGRESLSRKVPLLR